MLRLVAYLIFFAILIFIPFDFTAKTVEPISLYKARAVNVRLVEMSEPKVEKKKPEPPIEKPPVKPKPKPKPKEVIKKTKEPVPTPKIEPEQKPEPIVEPEVEKKEIAQEPLLLQESAYQAIKESYYQNIYSQIDSQKRYPKRALRLRQEGEVTISFTILADGSVTGFKILQKAGFESLNREIERVFKKIRAFSRPPSEIETPLEVTVTIKFNIKGKG